MDTALTVLASTMEHNAVMPFAEIIFDFIRSKIFATLRNVFS